MKWLPDVKTRPRKVVAVEVHPSILGSMMTEGYEEHLEVTDGLPEGARFVAADFDAIRGIVYFLYTHESFPEVEDGNIPPHVTVTFVSKHGCNGQTWEDYIKGTS